VTAGPVAAPPPSKRPGRWSRHRAAVAFLAPAVVLLGVWIVYPTVYTIVRSFFDREGSTFVGFDNYGELFSQDILVTAIKNNALWLAIVPALVTAIGLVFAVLLERVRWSVAFKTVVFMPMAISLFASGVIWRIMDQKEPDRGAVNAVIAAVKDTFSPPGVLSDASASTTTLTGSPQRGLVLQRPLQPGGTAALGLTGIPPEDVPGGAVQATMPESIENGVAGVVWRDFKPGGGTPGRVEQGELGLPGVTVELQDSSGKRVDSATSEDNGSFQFTELEPGDYRLAIGADTFAQPFGGVTWLGPKLITPALMIAYIWVWAGFAMVVIAAGLAAIPRDTLEAARTDGATEWQVFRRVTVPLLAPVLTVVFITMLINVLKIFDIVLAVAPGSVQDDANVIALAMWRTAFSGVNDYGLGSALAVFLLVLVLPILALNVRRFRREA
jgi:alpha-glucoside transport system permease protein